MHIWILGILLSLFPLATHFLPGLVTTLVATGAGLAITAVVALKASDRQRISREETARAEAEAESCHEQEDLHEAMFASLNAALLVADAEGIVTQASKGLLSMAGKSRDKVIGEPVRKLLSGTAADLMDKALAGKPQSGEAEVRFSGGAEIQANLAAAPIRSAAGNVAGAALVLTDLEELYRRQHAMEQQQEKLMSTGGQISEVAQRVASASEELSASADEQARGAQSQKHQSDTVATAMEEMTATVLEVAQNASATSEAAQEAQTSARDGSDLVGRAVEGINSVAQSASQLAQDLGQLDEQSAEIGRIINVINDIADQTNLLALNAAIEAARAGEAGRGFAVVADEVRKLAEKTMSATKEVEEAIRTIQKRSRAAMDSMEETEKQVQESTDLSNQAGQALQQIMNHMDDMAQRISQIATAAEQQSAAAEEINQSIEEIAVIAREADEGSAQTAEATRELAELSQELLSLAMTFSSSASDESKIWQSKGQMRGVLPKYMSEFIRQEYGGEVHKKMLEQMGNPVFLPTANYPDQVLKQMASIVAEETGRSTREVFMGFGRYTIPQFYKAYKRYFKTENLKELLLRMDEIHKQLTKDYPGINPPRFSYDDKGDSLVMTYDSKRGLFEYFEGILHGAAEFLGKKIKVKVQPLDDTRAKATISFK
jgi:methyl-accepting chemotaxis protein